jgi:hypothetical protein
MVESGTKPIPILPEEILDMTPLLRGLFVIRKTNEENQRIDRITTYAWFRFLKNDAGEVAMMIRKEIDETLPWQTLNLQKKRALVFHNIEHMDRPYCIQTEAGWIPQKRELQLEKQWDLYDLAQEFLFEKAQQMYPKPVQPRPAIIREEIVEDDAEIPDEEHIETDLFDEE